MRGSGGKGIKTKKNLYAGGAKGCYPRKFWGGNRKKKKQFSYQKKPGWVCISFVIKKIPPEKKK